MKGLRFALLVSLMMVALVWTIIAYGQATTKVPIPLDWDVIWKMGALAVAVLALLFAAAALDDRE